MGEKCEGGGGRRFGLMGTQGERAGRYSGGSGEGRVLKGGNVNTRSFESHA